MKKALFLSCMILSLAGCGEKHHDKAWYADHDAERKAKVSQCRGDEALARTSDCANAEAAQMQKTAASLPDLDVTK